MRGHEKTSAKQNSAGVLQFCGGSTTVVCYTGNDGEKSLFHLSLVIFFNKFYKTKLFHYFYFSDDKTFA